MIARTTMETHRATPTPEPGPFEDRPERWPTPIAVPLARAREAEEPSVRLDHALRTCQAVERFATLVALACYLDEEGEVGPFSTALDEVLRASAERTVEPLAVAHEHLSDRSPFGRAVRELYQAAELDNRMVVRDIVDGREVNREIGALSQIDSFRRDLPRNLQSIPRHQLPGTAKFGRILLDQLLAAAAPLARLSLVFGDPSGPDGAVEALVLEGGGGFAHEPIEAAAPLAPGRVHLVDRASGAVLALHPFVLYHDCHYCMKEKGEEGGSRSDREVFLFERTSAERVYYRGSRHSVALREFRNDLDQRAGVKRSDRAAPAPADDLEGLLATTSRRARENLDGWLGRGRFERAIEVPRHGPRAIFERFLEGRESPVLVVVGEEGIGKSTLAARAADEWAEKGHGVVYLSAAADGRLDVGREFRSLFSDRAAGEQLLAALEKEDRRRLVLIVDDLDRSPHALQVAESLRTFLESAVVGSSVVKVLLLLRDTFHAEASEEGLAGLLALPERVYFRAPCRSLDGDADRPHLRLERLDKNETETLWENLRRRPEHRPRSAFHELRRAVRRLAGHPEHARLLAGAYHDRDVPYQLTLENLAEQYAARHLHRTRERREFLESFVETLFRDRTESIALDALIEASDEAVGQQIVSGDPRSAYAGLLAEQALVRRILSTPSADVESIALSHRLLLDFLIHKYIRRRYDETEEILLELTRSAGPTRFPGALVHLLARKLANASPNRINRLLERGGVRVERLLAQTLVFLHEHATTDRGEDGPLHRLVGKFLETPTAGGLRTLDRVVETLHRVGRREDCARIAALLAEAVDATDVRSGRTLVRAGKAALADGDVKGSSRFFKKAQKMLRRADEPALLQEVHRAMAEIEIQGDRPRKALAWLDKALTDDAEPAARIAILRLKADVHSRLGQTEEAMAVLDRAVDLATNIGDSDRQSELYLARGVLCLEAGASDQAGFFLERAVTTARKAGDPSRLSGALDRLADFHRRSGQREPALAAAREALEIAEATGRTPELVQLHCRTGQDFESIERRDDAATHYKRARAIAKEIGDDAGLASAHHRLGGLFHAAGDHDRALDEYARALELWKRLGKRDQVAGIYHNIGMLQQAQGDNAKALEYYRRAEAIRKELGDEVGRARTYNHIARVHASWKEYDLAFEVLDKATDILFGHKEWPALATSHDFRGQILFEMERFGDALASYNKASQILESIGDQRGLAACLNNIALIHKEKGDLHEALKHFEEAATIQEAISDRRGLAATCNNIGVIHDSRGDYAKALVFYERDLEISRGLGDRRGTATSYNNIAILHYNHRHYAKALVSLEQALAIYQDLSDREMEDRIRERIRMIKERM